jgi:hypothetical protein
MSSSAYRSLLRILVADTTRQCLSRSARPVAQLALGVGGRGAVTLLTVHTHPHALPVCVPRSCIPVHLSWLWLAVVLSPRRVDCDLRRCVLLLFSSSPQRCCWPLLRSPRNAARPPHARIAGTWPVAVREREEREGNKKASERSTDICVSPCGFSCVCTSHLSTG